MNMVIRSVQRNYGIDLLRLVAAFYVIILHTLRQGGLFSATAQYSYQYYVCKLLLIFSYCAVNIFGIVSGFVGYREPVRKFSFKGYLSLWLDVVFYSVTLTLIYIYIKPETVTADHLFNMFFPVTKNLYWYFSAYTMVYFLSPFLNRLICSCTESQLKSLFFLICFVIVPVEFVSGSFSLGSGYSSLWLILLYLLGAIMKKTGICSRIRSVYAFAAIVVTNLCYFFLSTKYPIITFLNFNINLSFEFFETYVSPFFLISAIMHVIIFSKMHIHTYFKRIISFAAPAAFAVYIVNVQECIWLYFMKDRFSHWCTSSPTGIIMRTFCFVSLFVSAVVLVDFCKRKLFRLLKISDILRKLESLLPDGIL